MKRATFVLMMAAALAPAQDADRITIPFSNPAGPKTVRIDSMQGDIVVRAHSGNEVFIETRGGRKRTARRGGREMEGLKRIDIAAGSIVAEERENVISINSPAHGGGEDITVQVPVSTALRVKTLGGDVTVEGVHGDLELNSTNGEVRALQVEGNLVAHSLNGEVIVVLNRYDGKPMSFSTLNGDIDVTLPPDIKAKLKIKADHGEVYSDFDLKLEPSAQRVEQGDGKSGRYRVKIERVVYATVNGGGPEIAFTTLNGEIKIRRKK